MGDNILSSLSASPPCRIARPEELNQSCVSDETHTTVSLVDDEVAVEIITVTDYAEVELGTSTNIEVVTGENCLEEPVSSVPEDSLVMLTEESTREEEVGGAVEKTIQENPLSGLIIFHPEVHKDVSASFQVSIGPHDCPDCEKKFKFASSLTAHRVIHTGERPHRCNECGRCFSFRQSLERHRNTHKTRRNYDCSVCGDTFHSLSARTEHKQTHMEDGVYVCHLCNKKFSWELALARHLKTHTHDHNANQSTGLCEEGREVVVAEEDVYQTPVTMTACDGQLQADGSCAHDSGNKVQSSVPEHGHEVISLVKVRTSGRKRKPTMKIQVINLQKRMTTKRRKEITQVNPPATKPLPFNW